MEKKNIQEVQSSFVQNLTKKKSYEQKNEISDHSKISF